MFVGPEMRLSDGKPFGSIFLNLACPLVGIDTSVDGAKLPEYIPENIFYRLAMKAKNTAAEVQDFYSILSESTGGRPAQDAILSIDLGNVFPE